MDKDFVPVWVTRKQERIAPVDMTDTHLRNAIAYIRRNEDKIRKLYLKELAASVAPGYNETDDTREPHWTEDAEGVEFFLPVYRLMLEEAKRRGFE